MRLNAKGVGCVPPEVMERNITYSKSLGWPEVQSRERPPLAVVGGGNSIIENMDVLRKWPGEIWAINGAFHYLQDHGIEASFFAIDPLPGVAKHAVGAKHAVLATCCDPSVFNLPNVEVFDLSVDDSLVNHGPSTATAAPHLSIVRGHLDVTFFGCESSFGEVQTHAYSDEPDDYVVRVVCNGEAFVTKPPLIMQAEFLAAMIRTLPSIFKERSGGLLRAMIANPDYDITHGNLAAHKLLGFPVWMMNPEYGMQLCKGEEIDNALRWGSYPVEGERHRYLSETQGPRDQSCHI